MTFLAASSCALCSSACFFSVSCALAGEYLSLPPEVQAELKQLIVDSETWIARFFTEGRTRGEIPGDWDPVALARLWYATLQGSLVMTRATHADTLPNVMHMLKKMTLTPAK